MKVITENAKIVIHRKSSDLFEVRTVNLISPQMDNIVIRPGSDLTIDLPPVIQEMEKPI